jgi:hypothetical protein
MAIGTVKSEATVVFNCRQPAQSVSVSVNGKRLPACKVSLKYRGAWFHHLQAANCEVCHCLPAPQAVGREVGNNVDLALKLYDYHIVLV